MGQSIEPLVIGVRFGKVGKIYHFAAETIADIKLSDMVVVETSRGWQLGQVAQIVQDADPPPEGWKPIDRRATPRDLLMRQMWQMKEAEVVSSCRNRIGELKLVGIKVVSAEYTFDGSRLTILFSSETEEKYDLKSLRSDMQRLFAPSQVDVRQVGPRDVAKVMCGMGACGLETRCCCLFLTEFSSISIRMAKEQGISLTPTEITGMCGRLRCCLIYEYDNYVEARSKLPKRNKRVRTPQGEGKVVDVIPLRNAVVVDLPEVGTREFSGSEIQPVDGEGGQPAGTIFGGPQRPSEMDSATAGDEGEEPFVILTEPPPSVDTPRPMPRPESTERPGGQRRPGQHPGIKPDEQRRPRPGDKFDKGTGRPPSGGKGPRREGPASGQTGKQPGPDRGKPGPQNDSSPSTEPKPRSEAQTRGEAGRALPKGGRDHRRKKGKRRDDNDNENRA